MGTNLGCVQRKKVGYFMCACSVEGEYLGNKPELSAEVKSGILWEQT